MMNLGQNQRNIMRYQRILAQRFDLLKCDLAEADLSAITDLSAASHNRAVAYDAFEHVQSSSRFVPSLGRPAFCVDVCAEKRRNALIALVVLCLSIQSWLIVSHQKGTEICLRKLGLSQQSLHSRLLVAWKQTSSVVSLAQVAVLLQQKFSAQTRLQQPLLVSLLACCVTTPESAAAHAKTFSASSGRTLHRNRRRGYALAAIFRFKEPSHV